MYGSKTEHMLRNTLKIAGITNEEPGLIDVLHVGDSVRKYFKGYLVNEAVKPYTGDDYYCWPRSAAWIIWTPIMTENRSNLTGTMIPLTAEIT